MMNYLEMVCPSLLQNTPELLAWLFGIILAVIMVTENGRRAEKLFLAGCILMFVMQLASPFLSGLVSTLLREGWRTPPTVGLILQLPVAILGLAGFMCLIYAFWLRFRRERQELA
jgi:predicted cation transporter